MYLDQSDRASINLYTCRVHHTDILEHYPTHLIMGDIYVHHTAWGHTTTSAGTGLMSQLSDIQFAIINEHKVPTTEYTPIFYLAITSIEFIRNSHWTQVNDLVFVHISSQILFKNSFPCAVAKLAAPFFNESRPSTATKRRI